MIVLAGLALASAPKEPMALLVSAGNVPGHQIPGTDMDVRLMAAMLTAKCGFEPQNISILGLKQGSLGPNYRYLGEKTTQEQFRKGLNWISDQRESASRAVLYFSGHGTKTTAEQNREGLVMEDTGGKTVYNDYQVQRWLRGIPNLPVYLIFDCCFAAGAARNIPPGGPGRFGMPKFLMGGDAPAPRGEPIAEFNKLPDNRPHVLLAACRDWEQANQILVRPPKGVDLPPQHVGALTFALYQEVMPRKGDLSMIDVLVFASQALGRMGHQQTPVLTGSLQHEPFLGTFLRPPFSIEDNKVQAGVLAGLRPGAMLEGGGKRYEVKSCDWLFAELATAPQARVLVPKLVAMPDWLTSHVRLRKDGDSDEPSDLDIIVGSVNGVETVRLESGTGAVTIRASKAEDFSFGMPAYLALKRWTNPFSPMGLKIEILGGTNMPVTAERTAVISSHSARYMAVLALQPGGSAAWLYPSAGDRQELQTSMRLKLSASAPAGEVTLIAIASDQPIQRPTWLTPPASGRRASQIPVRDVGLLYDHLSGALTKNGLLPVDSVDVTSVVIRIHD